MKYKVGHELPDVSLHCSPLLSTVGNSLSH